MSSASPWHCFSWSCSPCHGLSIRLFWVVTLVAAAIPATDVFADESVELAKLLPPNANSLAVVRVEQIMKSDRAVKENWAQDADDEFARGTGGIPSWVKNLVVGFQIRPGLSQEVWAAGVAQIPESITVQSISQRDHLMLESLSDMPALRSPRGSYLLGIQTGILGIWRPGARQEAVNWARSISAGRTGLDSEYLNTALQQQGHVLLAIDLEHTLDPASTLAHLNAIPQLADNAPQRDQMQALLHTLRGVTLSATVGTKTTAQIRIDFQRDIGNLGEPVKTFFYNALSQMGAALEDFDNSKSHTEGKTLIVSADLSDENLRRIISLITATPSAGMTPEVETSTTNQNDNPAAQRNASRRYFRQVDQLVNDLSRSANRTNDAGRAAMWYEKAASRIDELPASGVDPALITYSEGVSTKLRALGRSLRGQQLELNVQQGTLTYDYQYNPGWASTSIWGGVGFAPSSFQVNSNLQQVRERQAEAILAGAQQREQVWEMLNTERTQILRQMQEKFGPSFAR